MRQDEWVGRRWRRSAAAMAAMGVVLAAPVMGEEAPGESCTAIGQSGMVASDSPYASQVGAEVLRAGGNAVDAAVATSLALAVTRPYSMGLGGGGFAMVRLAATGEVFVLDYRECAPGAASADMFVKARETSPDAAVPSRYGGLAVGVPGLLAGHAAVLERLGTRKLADLIAPARRLAAEGFQVDADYLSVARGVRRQIGRHAELRPMTAFLQRRFLFEGQEIEPGTILRQPELARAFDLIAEKGVGGFYRGDVAAALVRTVKAGGGIMTEADLEGYRPVWREPIRARYRDKYEVLLMPPPSSGGVAIAQTLNILEHWDLGRIHRDEPGLAAHLTVEALKHAFADRARHLGDADFAPVPVAHLVDKTYAKELTKRISESTVLKSEDYGVVLPDDAGTSHYSVVDQWGNVVSATETINTSFGSLLVVEGYGIVLNNEMDDFSAEPGRVNAYGLRQSDKNAVAPRKRPLSSMSPTIVLAEGKPFLAVGASGGPRIITATLQVMLDLMEYGLTLEEAIGHPRYHHQWQPDVIYRNGFAPDDPVIAGLRARGHQISDEREGAVVQAVRIEPTRLIGASDPRKGGRPAGY